MTTASACTATTANTCIGATNASTHTAVTMVTARGVHKSRLTDGSNPPLRCLQAALFFCLRTRFKRAAVDQPLTPNGNQQSHQHRPDEQPHKTHGLDPADQTEKRR